MTSAQGTMLERQQALLACASEWQDRNSKVRARAREAFRESEWPLEVVEIALDNVLRDAERVLSESGPAGPLLHRGSPLKNVLVILPGNVVGPTLATAFCAAAAGASVMLKSSSRELALAEIVAEQFGSSGVHMAETVTPVRWTGGDVDFEAKVFPMASRIIAFGDDATIADIRRRAGGGPKLIGYGSAYSLGFVPAGADVGLAAGAAATDVALFDQRGCLSPQTIYVEGPESRALLFGHALAKELEGMNRVLPRARAGDAEKAAVADFIRRLMVRALPGVTHALDSVHLGPRNEGVPSYVVGVEAFSPPVCAGFGRIAIVKPCRSVRESAVAAKSLGGRLDTIGVAGDLTEMLRAELSGCGAERICVLGEMQQPPLGYRPKIEDFLDRSAE